MSFFKYKDNLPEWKIFLKGSEEREYVETCELTSKAQPSLSAEEAYRAYGDIIGHDSFKSCCGTSQAVKSPVRSTVTGNETNTGPVPSLNAMMRLIESNNIIALNKTLQKNKQLINAVDSFGWSMLMCAACAGHESVVKLLLDGGADTKIRDKQGNSCLSLAKKRGHFKIASLIINERRSRYEESGPSSQSKPVQLTSSLSSCEKCQVSVQSSEMQRHLTSTVHLLNEHQFCNRIYYGIPESNRGYQLMLKTGWNRDQGLGPNANGRKYPLKTVLKKDRRGVGASNHTPRVTHFSAFDLNAVSAVQTKQGLKGKKACKHQRQKDIQKEKWKERNFRRELS